MSALLLAPPGDRVTYRLNDLYPLVPGGDVQLVQASADGEWIVYRAEAEEDNVQNLHSVPTDSSSASQKITFNTDWLQGLVDVTLSPDGTRVAYLQRQNGATKGTLHSVPSDGSALPVDLSGPHVTSYRLTSDSERAVFIGDILIDERFLLCSVPIDGSSAPLVLNAPLPAGSDVEDFTLSPDGTRVVYRSNGLFSAPVDSAGAAIQIDGFVEAGYGIDAGSARVVYRADPSPGVFELYSRALDGSSPALRLHGPLGPSRDVEDFVLGADATRVLFRADLTLNDDIELWSVPIDASAAPLRLHPVPVAGGDVRPVQRITADGARVVFRGDLSTDGRNEIWSAPIDGSAAAVKLNGPLAPGADVLAGFALAPSGTGVAFLTGALAGSTLHGASIDGSGVPLVLDSDPQFVFSALAIGTGGVRVLYEKPDAVGVDLWSAPFDGSTAAIALSAGETLAGHALIPGGVLYIADEDERTVFELFARPLSGGAPSLQINPELPDNVVSGSVSHFVRAGDQVLYIADAGLDDVPGLFSVPISRERAPIRISASSGPPVHVTSSLYMPLTLAPGGARAVFRGRTGTSQEVYSVPIDGTSEPVVLNAPLQPSGNVIAFELSSDGSRAVYLADQESDEVYELYRAQTDGSGSPVKLSGALVAGGDVQNAFQVDGDGSRAVYVASQDSSLLELYSADGVNPPLKLSGTLPSFSAVELDPLLSPDGAWVCYRVDASVNARLELFRAPVDGSSAPVKLSGTVVGNAGVRDGFRITPDGARVLFRAYGAASGKIDLFTVPADASAPPLKLNSFSGNSPGVSEVELDPLGTRAVFRNYSGNNRLHSVPVDGSAPDFPLTPLVGNQYVLEDGFQISADGTRVIYELFTVDCCTDLYSVPIDGSASPARLDALPIDPYIGDFEVDPTGQRVAFTDHPTRRLYSVPIDGASPALEIGPPPDGSDAGVAEFGFTGDGAALLYRLDVRQPGAYDLFVAGPGRGPRRADPPGPVIR